MSGVTITRCGPATSAWQAALPLVETLGQTRWLSFQAEWHLSEHLFVACAAGEPVGFLRLVEQWIGPDGGNRPVHTSRGPLREAKIMAFGVDPAWRRRGIGRELQLAAIAWARELDCYQVRSHSSGANSANHRLKLALGFGVYPDNRDNDPSGVYFLLPLHVDLEAYGRK